MSMEPEYKLEVRIARLEQENRILSDTVKAQRILSPTPLEFAEAVSSRVKVKALRKALREYGKHRMECSVPSGHRFDTERDDCDCGLYAALSGDPKTEGEVVARLQTGE